MRGIQNQIVLNLNNQKYNFEPGVKNTNLINSGLNTSVLLNPNTKNYNFNFDLDLKGTDQISFAPIGNTTNIKLTSSWQDPNFNGAFLPKTRKITPNGFEAEWNILRLNRTYPQSWSKEKHEIKSSLFGVNLLIPVDHYQKTMRTVKYAILIIALTFLIFFFIEVLTNIKVHPIQYLLVGLALALFYMLLLSLSEHIGFDLAYLSGSLATIMLISFYIKSILKQNKLIFIQAGILIILYIFIYIILQLENYALLVGTIGLFATLAIIMFLSKKIDWQKIDN